MNLKPIYTAILSVAVIQGCASTSKPLTSDYQGVNKSINIKNPDETYAASIDCAMEHITTPINGQFFTFQSDKLNKWTVSYHAGSISAGTSLGSPIYYKVRSSMHFGIKDDIATIDIKNITLAFAGSNYGAAQGVPTYGKVYTQEQADALDVYLRSSLDSMVSCVQEKI